MPLHKVFGYKWVTCAPKGTALWQWL